MEGKDNRREERTPSEIPEFIRAEFKIIQDTGEEKIYDLHVVSYSRYGLGMIVDQKDFDLLKTIKTGDELREVAFFTRMSMIKVDGIVKHVTKINEGKYKGCYLMGVESSDFIAV